MMNEDLSNLTEWFMVNKLGLNINTEDKCFIYTDRTISTNIVTSEKGRSTPLYHLRF